MATWADRAKKHCSPPLQPVPAGPDVPPLGDDGGCRQPSPPPAPPSPLPTALGSPSPLPPARRRVTSAVLATFPRDVWTVVLAWLETRALLSLRRCCRLTGSLASVPAVWEAKLHALATTVAELGGVFHALPFTGLPPMARYGRTARFYSAEGARAFALREAAVDVGAQNERLPARHRAFVVSRGVGLPYDPRRRRLLEACRLFRPRDNGGVWGAARGGAGSVSAVLTCLDHLLAGMDIEAAGLTEATAYEQEFLFDVAVAVSPDGVPSSFGTRLRLVEVDEQGARGVLALAGVAHRGLLDAAVVDAGLTRFFVAPELAVGGRTGIVVADPARVTLISVPQEV